MRAPTATASDDETVTVTDVAPTVSLVKSASPTTLAEPGGDFVFTLDVTNTSFESVTITGVDRYPVGVLLTGLHRPGRHVAGACCVGVVFL